MPATGSVGKTPEFVRGDVINLREFWSALMRHKWVLVLMFSAAVTAAVAFSFLVTPVYDGTTTIMVQEQNSKGQLSLFDALGTEAKNTNQNYVEVLKSRTVAVRAMAKLGYEYEVNSPQFADFRNNISVQLVNNTDAIRIKVLNTNPDEASTIANAIVDAFMDMNQEVNSEEARSARAFIDVQLKSVESELHRAEEALRQFKEREKVVAPSEEAKAVIEQLSELEKYKAQTSVEISQAQHQLIELRKKLKAEAPTTITSTTVSSNPMVMQFKSRLFELESELTGLNTQYNEDHPKIASVQAEINSVRQKLAKEVERIVSAEVTTINPNYQVMLQQVVALEVESVAQQSRQEALRIQIANVEKTLSGLPAKEVELTRLIRDQSVSEQVYLLLKNKSEEYRITEAIESAGVSVVDRAIPNDDPVKPKRTLSVAMAGFLGLLVGIGMIYLLEVLDSTLKNAEDVERVLGLPVVGSIPSFDTNMNAGQQAAGRALAKS